MSIHHHPTTFNEDVAPEGGGSGYASTLPVVPEDDVIARLHAVVREVTGYTPPVVVKPRIGFLP